MPLYAVEKDHVKHRCAACGADHSHALAHLRTEGLHVSIAALPQCACGAVEYLVGSAATPASMAEPSTFPLLHRLLVQHVMARLSPSSVAAAAEPPNEWAHRFPEGLRIPIEWLPPPLRRAEVP